MKKVVYLIGIGMFSLLSYAQKENISYSPSYSTENNKFIKNNVSEIFSKAGGDVVFGETFSSIGSWTTSGDDGALWLHDTDGPNGQYSNPTVQKIQSTSVSDGFMIFDADLSNASQPFVNRVGSLVSPVIDLSSTPHVLLYFEQYYRFCCSSDFFPKVELTSDGFQTVYSYDVSVNGISVNDNSGTKAMLININDFLNSGANMSTVQMRFVFDGSAGTSHYFWQIDDVKFIEQFSYDISAENAWIGDIVTDYENTEFPKYFNQTLITQLAIKNLGYSNPASATLQVEVKDANNNVVFNQSGGVLSNNFTKIYDTILFNTGFNTGTLTAGTYKVNMTLQISESDGNLVNNTYTRTFVVTDDKLSNVNFDGMIDDFDLAYNFRNQQTNELPIMTVGTLFKIPAGLPSLYLKGVDLALSKGPSNYLTALNETFRVAVWEYDTDPNVDFQSKFIQLSEDYSFQVLSNNTSTNGSFYTFNFSESTSSATSNLILESGKYYYVAFIHDGGIAKYFWYFANVLDDDYSSFVYGPFGTGGATKWFTLGYDPLIKLNLQNNVGLEELNSVSNSNYLYPNPLSKNDQLFFNLDLKDESSIKYSWLDLSGKTISSSSPEVVSAGQQKLKISSKDIENGMYILKVYINDEVYTYKMNVNR